MLSIVNMYVCHFVTDIAAYPDSVNVLETVQNDVRTPDKLIDGVSDTTDGCHMWLAPILPGIVGISSCDCHIENRRHFFMIEMHPPTVSLSISVYLSHSLCLCLSVSHFHSFFLSLFSLSLSFCLSLPVSICHSISCSMLFHSLTSSLCLFLRLSLCPKVFLLSLCFTRRHW